ncbi:MAG TPA: small ribosomal subunit Rsm22 family protein [Polyangia bacterium]
MKRRPHSRIHEGLTRDRGLIGSAYLADAGLRAEYAAEIAPRTEAAIAKILAPLRAELAGVRTVLDLGAGTGAAGRAVRAALPGVDRLVSVDQVAATAGVIVADLRREVRPRGLEGRFDLVVAAHVLNEMGKSMTVQQRAAAVFAWAHELSADGGHLLLVEPALRETSRDLLAVRDRLLDAGFFVVAPCFWQGPCPALARDRDWCHDSAPWPEGHQPAAGPRSRVDFSYLLLRRAGERPQDRRVFRVVSDPMVEKGKLRLFGCGPAGRHPLVRLDREATDDNADFAEAARGDVLVVTEVERAGDGLRVTSTSRVARR